MLTEFHFIRPYWLLALLPLSLFFLWQIIQKKDPANAWHEACDAHLLPYLIQKKSLVKKHAAISTLFASAVCMIVGLSGPSWSRYHTPTYHAIQPRVLLLDMSDDMMNTDVPPNRLTRAKFKLHDVLTHRTPGQFGLVVYTGEPFVVSPLTDDSQTIDSLLTMLSTDIMPVGGRRLDIALEEAAHLITQAGFQNGNILVLTGSSPDSADINEAHSLKEKGIDVSIMPILNSNSSFNPRFSQFAKEGGGIVVSMTENINDLNEWLKTTQSRKIYQSNQDNEVSLWRDQGRFLIIPALLLLLPVFRRGWLQRVSL